MVKLTQTIRRQFADELFEYVWQFCDIDTKRVKRLVILREKWHKVGKTQFK